ncbi:MAG: S4 domain-containing protein, partial [Selenomonadaceae bacterium]
GEAEAEKAQQAAEALFSGQGNLENVPTLEIRSEDFGMKLIDVLTREGVFSSKGEGRRLVQQNGLSLNDERISDADRILTEADLGEDGALVKKGKKKYYRLVRA